LCTLLKLRYTVFETNAEQPIVDRNAIANRRIFYEPPFFRLIENLAY
jgi:hypothetical protein